MEKLIACCGLNCATCEARVATISNDNELRTQIAEKWSVQYNSPEIKPEMINCTGCMEEGAKIGHCAECEVRNCVIAKGYKTCAECKDLETCPKVAIIHGFAHEALVNLKALKA